jgi:hypothetical protein
VLGIKIWYKTGPGMESKTDFYLCGAGIRYTPGIKIYLKTGMKLV